MTEAIRIEGKGYSENIIKALSVIRKELQPGTDEEGREKVMSFPEVSNKVRVIPLSAGVSSFMTASIRLTVYT
jgi:hypothetical protein